MPRCRVSDCIVKRAIFNYPGETQGICCSTHKLKNMINVKDKTCIYEGCNIQPNFNFPNEKTPLSNTCFMMMIVRKCWKSLPNLI